MFWETFKDVALDGTNRNWPTAVKTLLTYDPDRPSDRMQHDVGASLVDLLTKVHQNEV